MAKPGIHPYIPSPGNLVQIFTQFRKAMPAKVDASTLKRLALAPGNESMALNVLRFLGFVDAESNRTQPGKDVFLQHDDAKFAKALEGHVKTAYKELFDLRGDDAWTVDRDTLIGFFRATDETSGITASRQAIAFETLAALSGHGDLAARRTAAPVSTKKPVPAAKNAKAERAGKITDPSPVVGKSPPAKGANGETDVALTVRIEVNLPAQGDQETYDRIFKSIRANLLNG
jgi:hypothetical protein